MLNMTLKINGARLSERLAQLAKIGATFDNGVSRLSLTDENKEARDLVVSWMKKLGMSVKIDQIGNIFAIRQGKQALAPVMTGSHLDSVSTGGRFDGSLGVLAGLELVETLNENGIQTERPIAVAVFTNEEGVRYTPDMLGSLVYAGGLPLEEALKIKGFDGSILGEELVRINYAGQMACGAIIPSAFIELHIEQGPILEQEQTTIGIVQNLMGISWQELTITGQSNHAGTTPIEFRHDAGFVAAKIITFVRELAIATGHNQRGTCGMIQFHPNLINVIPSKATLTVDLRNSSEDILQKVEERLALFVEEIAQEEGVTIQRRQLARFHPVQFSQTLVSLIEERAQACGYSHRIMTSGAGHDAQMMSRLCPATMIFVPSQGGISHNPAEYTEAKELEAGANVLLHSIIKLANLTGDW